NTLTLLSDRGIIDPEGESPVAVPYLVVGVKSDMPESWGNLDVLKELYPEIDILPVSTRDGSVESLREPVYRILDVIRIYTKAPGKAPDMKKPFVIKRGSTVVDLAYEIHRD